MGDPDLDPSARGAIDSATRSSERNARPGRQFRVSLSIGLSALPPGRSVTLEELIDAADEGMYEDKRGKRESEVRLVHLEPGPDGRKTTNRAQDSPLRGV